MSAFPFAIVGFDLDGTLLDTAADLGWALNHALELAGRPAVPVTEVPRLIGGGGKRMLARALEASGGLPAEAELKELYAAFLGYYRAHIAVHTRPFPGVIDALDALQDRGVKLTVVSNKIEALVLSLLHELGLAERFAAILGGDSLGAGRSKPAPDLLFEMLRRAGPGSAAFVGDTTYDVRAARAAGLPCIAVRFGFLDTAPEALGADVLIGSYNELLSALERVALTQKSNWARTPTASAL